MPIPQSSLFGLCDWNERAPYTSAEQNDRLIVDPVDGLITYLSYKDAGFLVDTKQVFLVSDASKAAGSATLKNEARLPLSLTGTFTFEFDIALTEDLPRTFGLTDNRLYVGIGNGVGAVAGILFSYQGLALCGDADDPFPTLMGGSEKVVLQDDGTPYPSLTVRVIVDGQIGTTTVYASPTRLAYDSTTGGSLWAVQPDLAQLYTITTRTTSRTFSGVQLLASALPLEKLATLLPNATEGQSTVFGLGSLRAATGVLVPTPRPVAVVSSATQIQLGSTITFNGGGSYDLSGLGSLQYTWELEKVPDGSAALLSGNRQAKLSIGTALELVHKVPTSVANSYSVVISAQPLQGLFTTVEFKGTTLTIKLAVAPGPNGQLTPIVTATDIFDLFNNPLNPGYIKAVSDKFLVVVGSDPTALVQVGTYLFSSASVLGAGSVDISPTLNPDIPGFYVVSLVVSNGVRPSLKAEGSVLVGLTEQLFRHRPNTQFIFDHLPDFWNLVPDKDQITSIWSSMAQSISADVVSTWQADQSKAHRDVSRLYQRRWLPFSTEVVPDQTPSLVVPSFTSTLSPINVAFTYQTLTPIVTAAGSLATKRATLTGLKTLVAPMQPGDKVLCRSSAGKPKIAVVAAINNVPNTNDEWEVTFTTDAVDLFTVLVDNSNGYWAEDTSKVVQAAPMVTSWFSNKSYSLNQTNTLLDRVRVFEFDGKVSDYQISTVNPADLQGNPTSNVLKLNILPVQERQVDERLYRWQHLRSAFGHYVSVVPYIQFPAATDLGGLDIQFGDYVDFTMTEPSTGVEFVGSTTVLAVDGRSVFVQWDSLFLMMSSMTAAEPGAAKKVWSFSELGSWLPKFKAIRRSKKVRGYEDLVSVPLLGSPVEAQLYEGIDYYVQGGDVLIKDWVVGELVTVAGSADVTFTTNALFHADFQENALPLEELQTLGARVLLIEGGDAGGYQVVATKQNGTYTLDRPVLVTGNFLARMPRFHHDKPSLGSLWGEVSYFDNYKTIEGNFGLYVGLPKSLLDQHAPEADYLAVVRSMWFAYLSGATLKNLKLPIQALISLPYAESSGQIVSITPPSNIQDGTIVLVSSVTNAQHVYRYPLGADLAINPATGRVIKAYTLLTPPSNQAEQDLYDDSIVEQFTQLVEAVLVDDYISNPLAVDQALRGPESLRRLHTFVVTVPLDLTATTGVFPLIRQFLDNVKPAHTDYLLIGSFQLDDDINLTDDIQNAPTLLLKDGIAFSPFNALKVVDAEFPNTTLVPLNSESELWPYGGAAARFQQYGTALNLIPAWSAQAYAAGAEVTHSNRTWQARVGGAQAADVPGVSIVWVKTLAVGDVKERYESGYVEGVLDNHSGDGSYNFRNSAVDMINHVDHSDIDVCRSKMWLPLLKELDSRNFQIGEKLALILTPQNTVIQTSWVKSPPVVEYISNGTDPKLPGVKYLQQDHKYMYLLVGFEYEADSTFDSYGSEDRLRALTQALQAAGNLNNIMLRGLTSLAEARLTAAPTIDSPQYEANFTKFFHLERMFRLDKFDDYGPEDVLDLTVVQYMPFGGTTVANFQGASSSFTNQAYQQAVQSEPYRPGNPPDNEQFVPSVGAGCYTRWNLAPNNINNTNVNWGYSFNDSIAANPTNFDAFLRTNNPDIENTFFGMRLAAKKGLQFSQGFTTFQIPAPVVRRVKKPAPNNNALIRLEGHFFVKTEETGNPPAPVIPATPTTYGGILGGSWVFFRPAGQQDPYDYGTWQAATAVTFPMGLQAGETVVWQDAATQSRTGHVLEVTLPALADGTYDVVLRQYRPYVGPTNQALLHYDEAVAVGAVVLANGGTLTALYAVPEYPGQTAQDP